MIDFLAYMGIWLLFVIAAIKFILQGFKVHWGWGLANLLCWPAIIPFCFLHPRESKKPLAIAGVALALLLVLCLVTRI